MSGIGAFQSSMWPGLQGRLAWQAQQQTRAAALAVLRGSCLQTGTANSSAFADWLWVVPHSRHATNNTPA